MKIIVIVIFTALMAALAHKAYAHHHKDETGKMSVSDIRADSLMQLEMARHQEMEAVDAFPNYHPLIVHFPIVLLIIAALFQLLSFFIFKSEFSWATLGLLFLAVIATWLASNTFHAHPGELTGKAKEIFETHEQMASLTWWFSLAALVFKILSQFVLKRKWWVESIVTLLLIFSAVTVSIAGHHGAMLVHMEGIGPMGKYLEGYNNHETKPDTTMKQMKMDEPENKGSEENKTVGQEEDHHVGEPGKGPHGGTIEEADPFHMEIVAAGNDLIFYLLDDNAKSVDMREVTGNVKMQYSNKEVTAIEMMEMGGKLMAMDANNGKVFSLVAVLKKDGKSYSATFDSSKDLPTKK